MLLSQQVGTFKGAGQGALLERPFVGERRGGGGVLKLNIVPPVGVLGN